MNSQELIQALNPKVYGAAEAQFTGIGTDTRKDLKGQLFWALKGEAYDAHQFLPEAVRQGATGLVVHELPSDHQAWSRGISIFQVPDTLKALQDYARFCRRKQGYQLLGVTGSNGKTSTKEFAAAMILKEKNLHWNPGSFNNHFGLPFNLLQAPDQARTVIAEMGMNHAGELTELCRISEPDVVVCTMVGSSHIEHFGSVDKIADAKEEIYVASPPEAIRIYNLDNTWTQKMWDRSKSQYPKSKGIWGFSTKKDSTDAKVFLQLNGSSVDGLQVQGRIEGVRGEALIPILGAHNLVNLAAASCLALAAGIPAGKIWSLLKECRPHWGRMQLLKTKKRFSILFDGYNANPESMKAMLESLEQLQVQGHRHAVLAQMKELGVASDQAHQDLGRQVAQMGFKKVWFFGPDHLAFEKGFQEAGSSSPKNLVVSDNYEESLASEFLSVLDPKDVVVVKGSRGMATERFVLAADPLEFKKK